LSGAFLFFPEDEEAERFLSVPPDALQDKNI